MSCCSFHRPSFLRPGRTNRVLARARKREKGWEGGGRDMCAYREPTHRHSLTPRKRGVSASGLRRHCLPSPCPSFPSPAAHFPASIRTTQPFTNTRLYRPGRILRSGTVAAINVSGRGHVRALDPMAELRRIASICDDRRDESRCEYRDDILETWIGTAVPCFFDFTSLCKIIPIVPFY